MNAAKQAAWLFITLICLACSGWYFASSKQLKKLDEHTLSTTADMIISHLTVHQFDSNGHLSNYLQTPLMRHISLNNTNVLTTPHIVISQDNQPPWEIFAEQATSLYGGQQITFNKNVIVHQKNDKQTQESTLKTEAITYYPKEKLASTLLDVTYERPGNIVQSRGMNAYLAQKRVQLLSKARGVYEPNRG